MRGQFSRIINTFYKCIKNIFTTHIRNVLLIGSGTVFKTCKLCLMLRHSARKQRVAGNVSKTCQTPSPRVSLLHFLRLSKMFFCVSTFLDHRSASFQTRFRPVSDTWERIIGMKIETCRKRFKNVSNTFPTCFVVTFLTPV